jgi:hypothetical protein
MMRGLIVIVVVYLFFAVQVGLGDLLAISSTLGPVEPRLIIILTVLAALRAPARTALITAVVLGLLLDFTTAWPTAQQPGSFTIAGPYALGHFIAAYIVLEMRTMVFRSHPLAFGAMVLLGDAAVQLVVVGLMSVRQWYEPMPDFSARAQLLLRGMGLFYSAFIATLLAVPLNRLAVILSLTPGKASAHRR